jgi:hypothetical protein
VLGQHKETIFRLSCRKFLKSLLLKQLFLFVILLCSITCSNGQAILSKTVSVSMNRQPISSVLEAIERQGNFHFSYVNEMVHTDSLVSIKANNRTIRQVLDQLFQGSLQYKESSNQLLLQPNREKWFYVSGHITDATTGRPLINATVYESVQLVSTMTNDQGYYRLRLRERERPMPVMLTVSKELYKDTLMIVGSGYDQEISAGIKPASPITLNIVDVNQYSRVNDTWFGKVFLTSRQRMQSLNLSRFFAKQPYQYSILPGLGTHGKLGSQVINKISVNMLGGYTAGLNGVEFSGIFNIDQKDVRYFQAAGVFNVVGGKMQGVQFAGMHNHVMDSVTGFQAAGISNVGNGPINGVGAAGIANLYTKDVHGVAMAGIANVIAGTAHGLQAAGIINMADTTRGAQLSGVVNVTRHLKGVQIGVVNYADTSDGYSIGVVSIVRRGYHQLMVYNTELLPFNLAFKSGNKRLYSLIVGGVSVGAHTKAISFGYGMGKTIPLNPKTSVDIELVEQNLFLGSWESAGTLVRLQPSWNRELMKNIHFYAGPAFILYYNNDTGPHIDGYKTKIPGPYRAANFGAGFYGWIGWHIGLSFF